MKNKIAGLGIPIFFLLPWLGFVLSLFNIKSKNSAVVYVAFAMIFGYAISFTNTSADSYRYAEAFERFDNTLNYNTIIQLYRNGELRDIYRLLLFYFTSIFTNNPKVMYAFAGFVYAIFSYLNLQIFLNEAKNKTDKYVLILTLIFYTYISLSNINGFRFWTGGMVFFYATYNFIIKKQNKWSLAIIATPFIHYGFILIVPIIIVYRFIHPLVYNKFSVSKLLFYAFLLSFGASWFLNVNSISLGFISKLGLVSGVLSNRIEFLNSEDVANIVENRVENSIFLTVRSYFDYGIKIYILILIIFIKRTLKYLNTSKLEYNNLLAFVLFFYTFAFLATSFPSGVRFLNIAHLLFCILLVKIYSNFQIKNYKRLIIWALPVFSFNIVFVNIFLPIMILTPTFWYGNIFWIIIEGLNFKV